MGLPDGVVTRRITFGAYSHPVTGEPLTGVREFRPTPPALVWSATGAVLNKLRFAATLVDGQGFVDLPNNGGVLERDRAGRRLHACPSAGLDVRPPRRVPDGWPVRRVGHRIPHVSPHLARGRRGGQRGFGTLGGVGGRADSGRALPGYGTCRSALRLRGPESGQLDGMRGRGRRPSQKLDHRFRSRLRTQRPSTPHPGGCSTTLQATI